MGLLTAVVLKHLDENGGSIFFAQTLDKLNFCVNAVIVVNKSSHKTNNDDRWGGRNTCRGSGGLRARLTRDEEQSKNQ